jgi:branched-chain amino acid transport system substrate-binding protein
VASLRAGGFEPGGYTLHAYAAVQAWAQAVTKAGSANPGPVIKALHAGTFETVLGTIGFDGKGDVTGLELFVWYVWTDGKPVPVE